MRWQYFAGLAVGLGLVLGTATGVRADEWEENTVLYEDDAWYDVTEWFDGNDYNPTDEAAGRWDNETYDVNEDIGGDTDNDIDWSASNYGFYDNDQANDWYYDYNDYAYNDWYDDDEDGIYEYSSQYYDTDSDGMYESYATFFDTDGDGIYDDSNYYYFGNDSSQKSTENETNAMQQQKDRSSQMVQLSGTVKGIKQVRTKKGMNIVARLQNVDGAQQVVVDLGPKKALSKLPEIGSELSVMGPRMRVGQAVVVLAQKFEANGNQQTIDRNDRQLTGQIVSTSKMSIRNVEHQFAKLKTDQGKQFLVDLGPANALGVNVSENMQVSVSGPAIKVKDRSLLMAQTITANGKTFDIKQNQKIDNRTVSN